MMNKPDMNRLQQIADLLYNRIGPIDEIIEITDESMTPTFKPGSLAVLSDMPFPELINWAHYYYIVDINGHGRLRRVYASKIENCLTLVTDHPDQEMYPPLAIPCI